MQPFSIQVGHRYPVGVTVCEDGTNFCIFSRHATSIQLLLYDRPDSKIPFQVIHLDPETNRTFFFWHVFAEGMTGKEKIFYTWKVDGPNNPRRGLRFDTSIELLDPWAKAISDMEWHRKFNRDKPGSYDVTFMRGMVVPPCDYDWEGDKPLQKKCEQEIIYELHVGGFTRHHTSGVKHPGTYSGVIEKIPYLRELGITAVELMPVMAFDEQDLPDKARDLGLKNYWGYAPHSFFSPHPGYCIDPFSTHYINEFKDMVRALHKAGISVILDVVYNHTAEGGGDGPIINFKGLGNRLFYHLDEEDMSQYKNYSGCGNTVNCNHPLVAHFIIDSLEYWVKEFHIDGFRFDLASILARGEDGKPMYHAPVVWSIEFSDILAHTWLIAEAWDAGGLYQVGGFPGFRWAEWNGRYRDLVRQFIRGDKGLVPEFATRLTGSSDLYQDSGRLPINSINFVTCHDGFTLHDLVSYNKKHNQSNGEENRDGESHNRSWNCGIEGTTDDIKIVALRKRQVKNFLTVLLLSQGIPMILSGDEVMRSQKGNNNCYCQDNELSWFDWGLLEKNKEVFNFTKEMIRFRKRHPCLMQSQFLSGKPAAPSGQRDITWHGLKLHKPQWDNLASQVLACSLSRTSDEEEDLHIMFNMSENQVIFKLPILKKRKWYAAINTSGNPGNDILIPEQQKVHDKKSIKVKQRSIVVCESREKESGKT